MFCCSFLFPYLTIAVITIRFEYFSSRSPFFRLNFHICIFVSSRVGYAEPLVTLCLCNHWRQKHNLFTHALPLGLWCSLQFPYLDACKRNHHLQAKESRSRWLSFTCKTLYQFWSADVTSSWPCLYMQHNALCKLRSSLGSFLYGFNVREMTFTSYSLSVVC
jgi:hypothetical protein